MKVFSTLLAASVVCLAMVGCTSPHGSTDSGPSIKISANHRVLETGETTVVKASTWNFSGMGDIKWSVTPTTASVTAEKDNPQKAIFAANEAGAYVIQATAQAPDGHWVTDKTDVTVNGSTRGK